MKDFGSVHHTWIMLDNGEHRCKCGWSPDYYRDIGLTFEEQEDTHKAKIDRLEDMDPYEASTVLIAEVVLHMLESDDNWAAHNLIPDIAQTLKRWGFTRSEVAI